ncbi:MAG: VOC family protein [Candidatus Hodarchaeota archaeon]
MERINIDMGKYKINQLGYVYRDIDKQIKILENVYGLPKFAVFDYNDSPCKYRGKDSNIVTKLAYSRMLGVQFELIQLIEGECVFKEFLDSGREGLHHFGVFVDDIDSIIKEFLDKGYELLHERIIGKQKTAYFNTEKELGILIEFQETLRRKK